MLIHLDVPAEVADDLFSEDLAGIVGSNRSAGEVVQAVVTVVGLAANLVSIVVAVETMPTVVRRLLTWLRRSGGGDGPPVQHEIQVQSTTGRTQIVVADSSKSVDIVVVQILDVLNQPEAGGNSE
ncbi:hypothetical protein [Catelliglobosispora koreensis]|uniref:hypothetical protein n=1 Tax=Catelliglobosispora koreensis TaxID=129052 RepID=UPI000476E415|nr:hypothetical protein [Catelliglobosispora koreensis]